MRRRVLRAASVVLVASLTACAAVTGAPESDSRQSTAEASEVDRAWTEQRVQGELMNFADRFASAVVQESSRLQQELDTPLARRIATADKLYTTSSAFDIAATPDPGVGLLDMAILVRLKRTVWDENYRESSFGDDVAPMVELYGQYEHEIWSLVEQVYGSEETEQLAILVREWREQNEGSAAVAYARMAAFAESRRAARLESAAKPGGMLAPVRAANQELYELRRFAERATYLLSRIQLLIPFHVEVAYADLSMQPEFQDGLGQLRRLPTSLDGLATALDDVRAVLPGDVESLVDETVEAVRAERAAIFDELERADSGPRAALGELRTTLEAADRTVANLRETLDVVAGILPPAGPDGAAGAPLDLAELRTTVERAGEMVVQLRGLVGDVDPLLARTMSAESDASLFGVLDRWKSHTTAIVTRLFLTGVGLIALTLLAALIYRRIVRGW